VGGHFAPEKKIDPEASLDAIIARAARLDRRRL
jgi:hypothetical protein